MSQEPILHAISCLCDNEIAVFSIISGGQVEPVVVQCDECDLYHLVDEVCASRPSKRIPPGHQAFTFNELQAPDSLREVFSSYEVDEARQAYITWCLKNGRFGATITLSHEVDEAGDIIGRILEIEEGGKIKIRPFRTRTIAGTENG